MAGELGVVTAEINELGMTEKLLEQEFDKKGRTLSADSAVEWESCCKDFFDSLEFKSSRAAGKSRGKAPR